MTLFEDNMLTCQDFVTDMVTNKKGFKGSPTVNNFSSHITQQVL